MNAVAGIHHRLRADRLGYAGVMKGVALGINPALRLIDLTHQIAPQNVAQGAFALGVSYRYFPVDAIHVAVVDPGVGTSRRPILLQTPHGSFVGPDNGLLSRVLAEYLPDPPTRRKQSKCQERCGPST